MAVLALLALGEGEQVGDRGGLRVLVDVVAAVGV
jgi:hypothetical protein